MFEYTVKCTIDDAEVARRWLAWLKGVHIADVMKAGAAGARVVSLVTPGPKTRYEVHYTFASREAYENYILHHAPRLRAEGLREFPLELGILYDREGGDIVHEVAAAQPDRRRRPGPR